jgi:DHA3 family macrolide efflux protein-like MFS transporter
VSSVEETIAHSSGRAIPAGARSFLIVWCGQLASLLGSGLTSFAIGVWVYQNTGSVTRFGLISLCATLPMVLLAPVTGALVDHYGQKWAMLVGNCGAGLSILAMVLLLASGGLEMWHIYVAVVVNGAFIALHRPAYSASVASLVPKEHYGRANGLIQLGTAASSLGAPVLSGVLLLATSINTILLVDLATFAFAAATLLAVRIPRPARDAEASREQPLRDKVAFGWTFIRRRPGLMSLTVFFALCSFIIAMATVLVTPLVLGFADPSVLGMIMTVGAVGMLSGSLAVSTLGGPRRQVKAVVLFMVLSGVCITLAGLRPLVPLIAAAAFGFFLFQSIVTACIRTLLQTRIPADLQGRVFALISMIIWSAAPLAYPTAGPLTDYVFEPLLAADGALAASLGRLIGTGPGRGIGLLLILMGLAMVLISLLAYPRLRRLEDDRADDRAGEDLSHNAVASGGMR